MDEDRDDVSVSIDKGEFVFFIGPSGSGKSTIIKLLLHEVTPNKGKVVVNSQDVTSMRSWKRPKFRRTIGCVFQDFRLLPNRTAYENVASLCSARNASTRGTRGRARRNIG
jgi:cell division transport system ATP-binding protein